MVLRARDGRRRGGGRIGRGGGWLARFAAEGVAIADSAFWPSRACWAMPH